MSLHFVYSFDLKSEDVLFEEAQDVNNAQSPICYWNLLQAKFFMEIWKDSLWKIGNRKLKK
jgi:hypothetical protein